MTRHLGGDHERHAQALAQGLDAQRLVGGRADHREREAFGHADVPVHDDAEMLANPVFEGRFATGASSLIERFHAGNGVLGCFQGAVAGHLRRSPAFLLAGCAGGENGERGIAVDTQHLAAVIVRRAVGGLEELIEGGEKRFSAERLRQRRGAAQIAEPDDGPDVVPVAALDQALSVQAAFVSDAETGSTGGGAYVASQTLWEPLMG